MPPRCHAQQRPMRRGQRRLRSGNGEPRFLCHGRRLVRFHCRHIESACRHSKTPSVSNAPGLASSIEPESMRNVSMIIMATSHASGMCAAAAFRVGWRLAPRRDGASTGAAALSLKRFLHLLSALECRIAERRIKRSMSINSPIELSAGEMLVAFTSSSIVSWPLSALIVGCFHAGSIDETGEQLTDNHRRHTDSRPASSRANMSPLIAAGKMGGSFDRWRAASAFNEAASIGRLRHDSEPAENKSSGAHSIKCELHQYSWRSPRRHHVAWLENSIVAFALLLFGGRVEGSWHWH